MALFDRSYTTSDKSAIVNIARSCAIFEIFDIEEYRDFGIRLGITHARYVHRLKLQTRGYFAASTQRAPEKL